MSRRVYLLSSQPLPTVPNLTRGHLRRECKQPNQPLTILYATWQLKRKTILNYKKRHVWTPYWTRTIQLCLMNLRVKEKATVHRVLPPEPPPRRIPRARRRRRSRLPRQSLPRLGILKILSKRNNKDHKDFVFERIRRWFLYWNIYRLWNNHFTRLSLLRSKCPNPSILTILPVLVINVNHVKDVKRSPQKSDGGYEWCISEKTIFLDREITSFRDFKSEIKQLLIEANKSVELWKERCRTLEWNRDVWCKRVRELEKKFYCTSCVNQYQTVKTSNNESCLCFKRIVSLLFSWWRKIIFSTLVCMILQDIQHIIYMTQSPTRIVSHMTHLVFEKWMPHYNVVALIFNKFFSQNKIIKIWNWETRII